MSETQVETYRRDGVLPLGQVLSDGELHGAREHLQMLMDKEKLDRPGDGNGKFIFRCLDASKQDDWFQKIIHSEAVLAAGAAALGPDLQYFQDNIFYKPADVGDATPWHQDNIWWQSNPPDMLTVWIALDDVDDSNGAVHYLPASHAGMIDHTRPITDPKGFTYNVIDPARVDTHATVSFRVPAGHAVMHHCQTVHGAPANTSPRPRRAYTVSLMRAGLFTRDTAKHPLLRGRLP